MGRRSDARERMLGSAMRLFRERGVAGTSIADVMAEGQAPRGSLYHYFPGGKAELAETATARAGRAMGATISALTAERGPVGTFTAIIDLFRQQLLDTDFAAGCPVAAGGLAEADAPGARAAAGEAFASWESTLSASLWQHGIPAERADRLATSGLAIVQGALVLARAQRSTRPLDRVCEEFAAHLRALLDEHD
ncbi:TetR/AcrR family transcriptional regulator [Streptomyces sp. NBC_01803]|uniref:TetR/AcrR family transcriptional regulator n=1 Tax=Streptomyces sp. NBC_01803 TaxID=2975946 RepID=UPI002DDA9703|nr:TetR/AcrR family transcriptional regulator [Streptomyces sp. NBC_01803]WSA43638.1 TetR/AcrR family transcriptional regulator [Streptomyces sp. NBC_01803]